MKSTAVTRTDQGHWEQGQSGNPNGRPKRGDTMADYIRAATEKPMAGIPVKSLIADMLVMLALGALDAKVRLQAIGMIIDYTDGRPPTRIMNAADDDGDPIPLRIIQ